MLTDSQFLQLVYESAKCYVTTKELNEKQRKRLDNITYRWCKCQICTRESGNWYAVGKAMGHSDKNTLEICFSRSNFKECVSEPEAGFLLELIMLALHEIVHILYPEFSETETVQKTSEWIKRNEWFPEKERFIIR